MVFSEEIIAATLGTYLDDARKVVKGRLGSASTNFSVYPGILKVLPSAKRAWFDECESLPSWEQLTRVCYEAFLQTETSKSRGAGPIILRNTIAPNELRNWFRRRDMYSHLLDGQPIDYTEATKQLITDAQTTEWRIIYLALLDGVRLHSNDPLDFGGFQIVKPSSDWLEHTLRFETNRLFYPKCICSTYRLSDHWYIRGETHERRESWHQRFAKYLQAAGEKIRHSDLPTPIEAALKILTLWDWQSIPEQEEFASDEEWLSFRIAFIIGFSNNPFEDPPLQPSLDILGYTDEDESGKLPEPQPNCPWKLDEAETQILAAFVRDTSRRLETLNDSSELWQCADRALGSFLRAFLSKGFDQLLWHMIAIEALLGDDKDGLVGRIKRRIKFLYGQTGPNAKKAAKAFQDTYDARSKLVHGDEAAHVAYTQQRNARVLARRVCEVGILLFSGLLDAAKSGSLASMPRRRVVVDCLDYLIEEGDPAIYALAATSSNILKTLFDDHQNRPQ
jgi:hypothetical protein